MLNKHLSIIFAFLVVLILTTTQVRAAVNPLTEDQIIKMSTETLKAYPDEIVKLVRERGITFFLTKTTLTWLERSGVFPAVISAIREKGASQMRIKICTFNSSDADLAKDLATEMIKRLGDIKTGYIDPFGKIPLDDQPCSPQGFDNNIQPIANTFYILVQGWIRGAAPNYTLDMQVIYQDPTGRKYPLPDADNQPKSVTKQTIQGTAYDSVNWVVKTAEKYART